MNLPTTMRVKDLAVVVLANSLVMHCSQSAMAMSPEITQKFQRAQALYNDHKGLQARQILQTLSDTKNASPEILCLLCDTYLAEGPDVTASQIALTEKLAKRALILDPEWGNAYKILAQIANEREDHQKTVEMCNKALAAKKPDVRAYLQRTLAYQALGNDKAALADITVYVKIADHSGDMHCLRASILKSMKRPQEEIEEYKAALKAKYSDYVVYQMAHTYEELGQYPPAIAELTTLIKSTGKDAEAYQIRGHIYGLMKKYNEAIADYTKAISLEASPRFYKERSAIYQKMGNTRAAQADLAMSKKQDIDDPFGR